VNRREYLVIFVVLFVLTVLEVVVAQLPGIGKTALGVALVTLALAKAAFVALFYMHLKHETRILRLSVAIPLAAPALYAFVLIADAAWRLTR
jgi:caa(3)-type oxidase subunit IV